MKQDLVIVNTTPAVLDFDFEAAKAYVESELEKYDVVVTLETLPGGKELAKELNKTATQIDETRKEKITEASVDIKKFDENTKVLVNLCKEGRVKILDQIKVFEDKTRATIKQLMIDLRQELYTLNEVEDEFKTLMFPASVPLNYLTPAGNLSGKIKAEIEAGVLADLQAQKDVEMRLVKLENESYKAGLKSPLSKIHVQAFLMDEESTYQEKLSSLLAVEVKRQEVTEEEARKRALRETSEAKPEPVANDEPQEDQPAAEKKPAYVKPAAPVGQTMHVIQATFEVPVPENIDVSRVVAKLEKVMKDAGITTLVKIEAVE